ncbi:MAG: NUDIX hydrolase [Myxococcaceae bacterium]
MTGKRIKPWTRLSQGPATDFSVLKIREVRVADPRDGSEHPRVLIEAPDWVNIIPVTREGQVVLIRQFRFGVWGQTLEIPGGMTEPDEAPQYSAERELEEETGYRAARVVALGSCHPNPALQANRTYSFLAEGCEKVSSGHQDAGEDIAVELVERADIPRLIREGQITHSLVLVAFLLEQLRQAP